MSFLAAAFLAGFAALVVPWWLHRRDTRNSEQQVVSSLLLMRPGEAPEQMRRVLRHRWLMALRMLLLAVLAAAFAQPVLQRVVAADAGPARLPRIVAVDTSLSMGADFAAARALAHRALDDLPPGGRGAVVGVADDMTVAAAMTADRIALHAAIDGLRAGNGRLSFDGLTGRLSALAATMAEGPVELHLVSDFQRTAMPAQFNGLIAGAEGPVILHRLTADAANWGLDGIAVDDRVTVTVRGFATPAQRMEVVLRGPGGELGRRLVAVSAGGTTVVSFPLPPQAPGDSWLQAALQQRDALSADNARFHALRRLDTVALPVFASPAAGAQLDYLEAGVAAAAPHFRLHGPGHPGAVAVAVDPGDVPADRLQWLEDHLASGGALLMTMGPATRLAGRLPLLDAPLQAAPLQDEPRRVVPVDARHPALAGVADWRPVTVSRHLRTDADRGEVLLALDDGSPLLVEHRLAAGRLLVLMTALDPEWSNLVTTPAFVTLLGDALGFLAEDTLPAAAVAGRPLTIPAANVQLFDRSGRRMLALGETVDRPSVPLAEPGVYTLRTPTQERLLAVNIDSRESDLEPAPVDLLTRWEAAGAAAATPVAASAERNDRVALAPWLLALLGLLAVAEPLAANAVGSGLQRSVGAAVRGGVAE